MSSEALEHTGIGWYGKLPAAGDFLRHGLPDAFVDEWDAWLRAGMAAAASEQGESWQDNFLRFPVWHFLRRMPEADSDAPGIVAGLLVPSVDRVGRLFPLTVAFTMPAAAFQGMGCARIEQCLIEIEEHALDVLGNDDLEGFAQALAAVAVPPPVPQPDPADLPTPSRLIDLLGAQALCERLAAHALFWTRSEFAPRAMLSIPEPLQAQCFGQLVLPAPTLLLSE